MYFEHKVCNPDYDLTQNPLTATRFFTQIFAFYANFLCMFSNNRTLKTTVSTKKRNT